MSLRQRLTLLLSLFGLYAVVAAIAGIVGSQLRVNRAAEAFQRIVGQTSCTERVELLLAEQVFLLGQLAEGQPSAMKPYAALRENWALALQQCTAFASSDQQYALWSQLRVVADELESASNEILERVDVGDSVKAVPILVTRVQAELVPSLQSKLQGVKAHLAEAQNESARGLASAASQSLALTSTVGLLAAALVIGGSILLHRWLLRPIAELHRTARHFREGNLAFRNQLHTGDELGELAAALNEMAEALAATERKHQTLFANLRDAVVICDRQTQIVEYHDGDTRVLGIDEPLHAGRPLLDVWPQWAPIADWPELIRAAVDEGRRAQIHEAKIPAEASGKNSAIVDFVIYRVDAGRQHCAAIVARDTTQRYRLQERLHHAETMEALGTLAGGLAHDINNLLASVVGALSNLTRSATDPAQGEQIARAMRATRRAAGLTKRLLNFAQGFRGTPQVFRPAEIVETILDSLDPSALGSVTIERRLDRALHVRMDQDQFAQLALNVIQNALDAMYHGGRLVVELHESTTSHPERHGRAEEFAVLVVADSGVGMLPEVECRMFEPFFSTKTDPAHRGRGMGLAVVYSAVRGAGGFLQVETEPGCGTTFRAYLPTAKQPVSGDQPGSTAAQGPSAKKLDRIAAGE